MTDKKPPIERQLELDLLYFIAAVLAVLFIRELWNGQDHIGTIPLGEFPSLHST